MDFFFAETNFCCQEVISLDAYKAAAQENAEFLACLGIEWEDSELPFFFLSLHLQTQLSGLLENSVDGVDNRCSITTWVETPCEK